MKATIKMLIIALALFFMISVASAEDLTGNVTVSVTVSSVTWVNIDPETFSWTVNPGSEGGPAQEGSGYGYIQIENIGSRNITKIWFNNSFESSRPFGTGSNASYDSGNYVVIGNETDTPTGAFFFPNRVEFNESRSIVYLKDVDGNMPPSSHWWYGRFRNASFEYFWMMKNNTEGLCNYTGNFYIGKVPHTRTQTGSVDFSNAGNRDTVSLTAIAGTGWAVGSIPGTNANGGYCVAMKYTCDQVFFYKWNVDMPGAFAQCTTATYFLNATSTSAGALVPGESIVARIRVRVPYGVYEGISKQGLLQVLASDQ